MSLSPANTIRDLNLRHGYDLDAHAIGLAALFAIVIPASIMGVDLLTASGVESVTSGESAATQASGGAAISVVTVIEASILLGVMLLFHRFPGWLRPALKQTARIAVWGLIAVAASQLAGGYGFATVVAAYFLVQVADQVGVYWFINGVVALAVAIYGSMAFATLTSPIVLGAGLVGLTVYDHVFANRRPWMGQLARSAIRWKLPVMVVLPTVARFDWARIADEDTENEFILFGLGLGDLVVPSAFVASVYHGVGVIPAAGVTVGITLACLRLSWAFKRRDSMAGLPSLATGCLGGFLLTYPLVLVAGGV